MTQEIVGQQTDVAGNWSTGESEIDFKLVLTLVTFQHLICVECMQHHSENGGQQGLGMVRGRYHLIAD